MVNRPTLQSVSVIASRSRTQQQRGSTDVVESPTGTIREMVKMKIIKALCNDCLTMNFYDGWSEDPHPSCINCGSTEVCPDRCCVSN